jgi:predicted HAD superfamily hydrolase
MGLAGKTYSTKRTGLLIKIFSKILGSSLQDQSYTDKIIGGYYDYIVKINKDFNLNEILGNNSNYSDSDSE